MHITTANKHLFDDFHYHDAWFHGFNYDYRNRTITFSMEDSWKYDHFDFVFNNVIYFEVQSCTFWGGSEDLYDAYIRDELPELDRLNNYETYSPDIDTECMDTEYIGVELIVKSGDTILIICESVDVDAVGIRQQNN